MTPADIQAAVKLIANLLPDLVSWIGSAFRDGRDPEAELRLMMLGAEEAARLTEAKKFGGDDA